MNNYEKSLEAGYYPSEGRITEFQFSTGSSASRPKTDLALVEVIDYIDPADPEGTNRIRSGIPISS